MNGKITEIIIVSIIVIIITIIMDFKIKNFMPEIYNNILIIIIYFFLIIDVKSTNGIIAEVYDSFVLLLIPIAIIGTYTILKKNKIYYFKGIDRDYIKRNINEISKIINDYKNNNLDDKSEISLINSRIVFEKVSEPHIEECLSLVGNYLDENREKYTIKDYMTYYTKTIAIPITIVLVIAFILFKIVYNDSPLISVEQISIKNETLEGNTEGNINNYGLVAETVDSIYYINDLKLYKYDKFQK